MVEDSVGNGLERRVIAYGILLEAANISRDTRF